MDYHVGVSSANAKGYAVGIYDKEGHAVLNSSSFEPSFERVITKLTQLALEHPEAFTNEMSVSIGANEDRIYQKEDVIIGLQKLVQKSFK